HRRRQFVQMLDIGLDDAQARIGRGIRKTFDGSGRKVVVDDDAFDIVTAQQPRREMRADEARSSGYERAHCPAYFSIREADPSGSLEEAPMLPVAILCGGLGTRLLPKTETVPKALLSVSGEPFVFHQLRLL